MLMLARLVRFVTAAVVVVIVLAIVLHVLDASTSNGLVSAIHDAASWLVGPFKGLFSIDGQNLQMAVNWGLAALAYAIVGGFISSLLARAALRGERRTYTRSGGVAY